VVIVDGPLLNSDEVAAWKRRDLVYTYELLIIARNKGGEYSKSVCGRFYGPNEDPHVC